MCFQFRPRDDVDECREICGQNSISCYRDTQWGLESVEIPVKLRNKHTEGGITNLPFVFKSDREPVLKARASKVFSRASSLKCSMKVDRSKSRKISSVPLSTDSATLLA